MNDTVHDTTDKAKDKAREVTGQAQDKAKDQLDSRTTGAGDQLQDKADNLHAVGDEMRERGDDTFAQVADKVAGWTEDAARYLREADADRLLGDVESYARKSPWAVAAGGVLLGFAASRVVRSGTDRRSSSQDFSSGSRGSLGADYGTSYQSLEDRETDRSGVGYLGTTSTGTGTTGTGTGTTGTTGTGYLGTASIAPEPTTTPDLTPVPDTSPVPDPDPLGDPVPGTQPGPSTGSGQDRPFGTPGSAHVDR